MLRKASTFIVAAVVAASIELSSAIVSERDSIKTDQPAQIEEFVQRATEYLQFWLGLVLGWVLLFIIVGIWLSIVNSQRQLIFYYTV